MIMRCLGDSLHLIHCTMIPFLDIVLDSLYICVLMCRNHPSFTKDLLNVQLTQYGLLLPVIFGRF